MSQTAKANEPSMEEILASIRRIIADDEPPKPAAAPLPQPAPKHHDGPRYSEGSKNAGDSKNPGDSKSDDGPKSQDDIDALLAGFDEAEPEPAPSPPARPAAAEPEIFELSRADAVPERVGMIRPVAQRTDVEFMDRPEPPPAPASAATDTPLLSAEAHAAVGAAFGSLANTILSNNARTIEDLVKEMLRPMLKTWLDDNLPQLVERLVRAEIERVSRGAGR